MPFLNEYKMNSLSDDLHAIFIHQMRPEIRSFIIMRTENWKNYKLNWLTNRWHSRIEIGICYVCSSFHFYICVMQFHHQNDRASAVFLGICVNSILIDLHLDVRNGATLGELFKRNQVDVWECLMICEKLKRKTTNNEIEKKKRGKIDTEKHIETRTSNGMKRPDNETRVLHVIW